LTPSFSFSLATRIITSLKALVPLDGHKLVQGHLVDAEEITALRAALPLEKQALGDLCARPAGGNSH
jgi:hypothetical protein